MNICWSCLCFYWLDIIFSWIHSILLHRCMHRHKAIRCVIATHCIFLWSVWRSVPSAGLSICNWYPLRPDLYMLGKCPTRSWGVYNRCLMSWFLTVKGWSLWNLPLLHYRITLPFETNKSNLLLVLYIVLYWALCLFFIPALQHQSIHWKKTVSSYLH